MMILTQKKDLSHGLYDLSGTFAGLMDLYERNYIGVRRLIPVMPPAGALLCSRVPGGLNLYLEVIERFPYTSEISLTYHFFKEEERIAEPDMRVRVYSDARQAEVVAAHLRQRFGQRSAGRGGAVWGIGQCGELAARWRVNRFLYKWLGYCLHQGHRF